ncbi:MAG: hypothetical protein H0W73_07010 [Bacteroidetes bacterium]|nr:hypothetical protein [Bacteroidota bacterium]
MPLYKNISKNSGIISYSSGKDFIKIVFRDGESYVYSYVSAGKQHIDKMKKLAARGKGLTTYINKYVKEKYAAKL